MYNLIKKEKGIQNYFTNESLLFYTDSLYLNFHKIPKEDIIGGSFLSDHYILVNENDKQTIYTTQWIKINSYNNNVLITDVCFQDPLIRMASVDSIFNIDGSIVCNWVKYDFKSDRVVKDLKIKTNYCFPIFVNEKIVVFQEMNILICYNLDDGSFLWEYNNKLAHNEIIGFYKDLILLPINDNSISVINVNTGKMDWYWKELPGINPNTQAEGIIPDSKSFVLDKKTGKLIGALHKNFIEIDLETNAIHFVDILEEMQKHEIIFIKQLNKNPFTDTHLFLTAMMEQEDNDKKWSKDCLFALNRQTLKIDWMHVFEKQNLGTNIPKLTVNELYQLDNEGTLHIFKKEEIHIA